ncbi:MAG: ABC transporter substrate-binding protein [Roseburia sp.]|jgi:putative aldouronate transport system substrate-binding protein|nr:ABC transporter substrate-binding protein [Roseburia sp.]
MRRKRMTVFSAAAMAAVMLFTGCGDAGGNADAAGSAQNAGGSEAAGASGAAEPSGNAGTDGSGQGEVAELVMQWPSMGVDFSGFQDVEDALNELLEKDIGVHVILEPVQLSDLTNSLTLAVSSGEQVDITLSVGDSIQSRISNGLIQPVDAYIDEYGSNLKEVLAEKLPGGYVNGELYAIPCSDVRGNEYGYRARKDLLDKYGITVDEDKLYTLEEIEEIFAAVKAGEGDKFYCQIPMANSEPMLSGCYMELDLVGATTASGTLMLNRSFEDLTLVNMYETDEYMEYAKLMYDWANKGYISKDAATNAEDPNTLVMGGNYLGYFSWTTPNGVWEASSSCGYDMVALRVLPQYVKASTVAVSWQVPTTAKYPDKAVQVLDYIMGSEEATVLLQFGMEGQSYEVLEENGDGRLIKYLSDDPTSLPYYMPYGVYGNRLEWPVLDPMPADMYKTLREMDAAIPDSRVSGANGYTFDNTAVSTEYSAVTTVVEQYSDSIDAGAVDPEIAVPEFIAALKAAGIDKVIEENQRQLDEWAAANK